MIKWQLAEFQERGCVDASRQVPWHVVELDEDVEGHADAHVDERAQGEVHGLAAGVEEERAEEEHAGEHAELDENARRIWLHVIANVACKARGVQLTKEDVEANVLEDFEVAYAFSQASGQAQITSILVEAYQVGVQLPCT